MFLGPIDHDFGDAFIHKVALTRKTENFRHSYRTGADVHVLYYALFRERSIEQFFDVRSRFVLACQIHRLVEFGKQAILDASLNRRSRCPNHAWRPSRTACGRPHGG
jgi:hypothetical protein